MSKNILEEGTAILEEIYNKLNIYQIKGEHSMFETLDRILDFYKYKGIIDELAEGNNGSVYEDLVYRVKKEMSKQPQKAQQNNTRL